MHSNVVLKNLNFDRTHSQGTVTGSNLGDQV